MKILRYDWHIAGGSMATEARQKVGLNVRTDLYERMTKLAKDNGQTATYVLDQALEHYINYVAPTQHMVRPEIMALARKSIEKNRKLLDLLAK
jgi:predicted transcriptional regulator